MKERLYQPERALVFLQWRVSRPMPESQIQRAVLRSAAGLRDARHGLHVEVSCLHFVSLRPFQFVAARVVLRPTGDLNGLVEVSVEVLAVLQGNELRHFLEVVGQECAEVKEDVGPCRAELRPPDTSPAPAPLVRADGSVSLARLA